MSTATAPRFAVVRNQGTEILLETAPADLLPPLADVPQATEPEQRGAHWRAPVPNRPAPIRSVEQEHPRLLWLYALAFVGAVVLSALFAG